MYYKYRYNNRSKSEIHTPAPRPARAGDAHPRGRPDKISHGVALATLKLSLPAPIMLMKYLAAILLRNTTELEHVEGLNGAALMAFMSARVGSISDNQRGGWYSYRASKAGLNQLEKTLDIFLQLQAGTKAMSAGLHPGTAKTDLSREFWESTPKGKLFETESAERLLGVLKRMVSSGRGKCWDWAGKEILP